MSTAEKDEKIVEKVGVTHKTIEKTVVDAYRATETGAVDGLNKVPDKFIEKSLTKDGKSIEETRKRLTASAEKSKVHSKDTSKKVKSHKY